MEVGEDLLVGVVGCGGILMDAAAGGAVGRLHHG